MFIVVISWKIRLEWMKTGGSGLPPFVESRIIGDATRGAPGAYLIYMDQLDMLGPWSVGRTVSVGSVRYESRWANLMAHLRPVWRNFFSTPSHRIHGAGIYANIWGYLGYIDGKCYHIYIYIPYMDAMGIGFGNAPFSHTPMLSGVLSWSTKVSLVGCHVLVRGHDWQYHWGQWFFFLNIPCPNAPWCWNIYQHLP